ncbi:acyl carrier protein [Pseudomonas aeruginosa]|nr:acyl carrier protein [Pseudomonas aeruginosa]
MPKGVFFELGLTSISLIEFKRKLEARVGLELPATVGFDYPNLEALARRLEQLGAAKEIQPTTCAPAARGRIPDTRWQCWGWLAGCRVRTVPRRSGKYCSSRRHASCRCRRRA